MIDPDNVPAVSDDELLARFVTQSKQCRSDGTVKPDLFIQYRHVELSVIRHLNATEDEIWSVGCDVANAFERTLHGRADILASKCKVDTLRVVEKPLPRNPNHADIAGWPHPKQDQKAIALKLAASASKLIRPASTS